MGNLAKTIAFTAGFTLMSLSFPSCSGPIIHSYLPINMGPCLPGESSETEQVDKADTTRSYQDSSRTNYLKRDNEIMRGEIYKELRSGSQLIFMRF